MKFDKIQFVYIDTDYLEYLHSFESELYFNKNDENYDKKPHLGILLNNNNIEYVIPLTSGKEKHVDWADVSASWYKIYEIIDITCDPVKDTDIITEIKNQNILKSIKPSKRKNCRQRILSVLDMRKMFPITKSLYTRVDFSINNNMPKEDSQRIFLMIKEFNFLEKISQEIEMKATKIYDKQISKNKVIKFHCDFKRLENALDKYVKTKEGNTEK